MSAKRFFLRPEIFLAFASRYVVILDVHRDRYTCVLRKHFDALGPWLSGWPSEATAHGLESHLPSIDKVPELAAPFLERGILTVDALGSKPVCPISVAVPKAGECLDYHIARRSIWAKAAAFFWACHRAHAALRHRRFESVIGTVSNRRRRCAPDTDADSTERALRLFAIFHSLRPLYPRAYLCTFDSLALLEFLALWDLHPRWIFGVRADPFQAHCWVQHGQALLNDRIDRVRPFVPIMAV